MDSNVNKLYSKINNNDDYIVFGLSTCVFCENTKEYLKKNKISYKYYPIDDFKDLFFKNLIKLTNKHPELNININQTTVPVIFYKKKFIGGYNDLMVIMI
jgi:glutaredoxin